MHNEYDVIICGGGPVGIGAAVAAGQAGVKTLLVEMTSGLGGMMTNARISSFCDSPGGPVFDALTQRLLDLEAAHWRIDTERAARWLVRDSLPVLASAWHRGAAGRDPRDRREWRGINGSTRCSGRRPIASGAVAQYDS